MTLPPHLLGLQNGDSLSSGPDFGHRYSQSFGFKSTLNADNPRLSQGSFHSAKPSFSGFAERPSQRNYVQPINTNRQTTGNSYHASVNELQSPQTGVDMNFTPLLPSGLLMGSPFQPGSPTTFHSPQFQSFSNFSQHNAGLRNNQSNAFQHQSAMSPTAFQNMASSSAFGTLPYYGSMQSPTSGYTAMSSANMGGYGQAMQYGSSLVSGTSRTVYLGNIPPDTSAEEILGHVRSGQIESVRILTDKNCAFISFLDGSSATHFHSDAILKKLSIKGQDIKVGWGKPSSVPTSVALAVQQSGASRNVYLGNLPEDISEHALREELSKFGAIDTVKIVREKAIGFVHFLSIGNAIKAVSQLPQDPKWQSPRRVYYGKDRCAYVSKTQQQNAAQYLGIAPGYAHVLNGADRDLITNALAQQSVAAAAVATTAGGVNNLGNRTVYLGNIHPETTIEEICNVVRGGLLHHIRYIPDKHICFVTFIDPTSAASFYALSNLQGLMIHNRRLKIGWGKHSGALPPAIALAVSGGASRNVYVGNLDETWSEERLRQDFQEYGEIELVNTLREKSCAFVNFTNIANAIKAIEAVRGKEEYKRFKVNFGKDRCGNPPRQIINSQQLQQLQQQQSPSQGEENGVPSPTRNGLAPSRTNNSISPASSVPTSNGMYNPLHGPTASTVFNSGNNNPLTLYLAAAQQSVQNPMDQQDPHRTELSPPTYSTASFGSNTLPQPQSANHLSVSQAFYNSPNEVATSRSSSTLEPRSHASGHASSHSMNLNNGIVGGTPYNHQSSQQARNSQHSRTVSLPAFSLQAAQQAQQQQQQQHTDHLSGLGSNIGSYIRTGGYGLGVSHDIGLHGWAEEEVV